MSSGPTSTSWAPAPWIPCASSSSSAPSSRSSACRSISTAWTSRRSRELVGSPKSCSPPPAAMDEIRIKHLAAKDPALDQIETMLGEMYEYMEQHGLLLSLAPGGTQ